MQIPVKTESSRKVPDTFTDIRGITVHVYRYNTVVVGSGAAGYNTADSLCTLGMRDVAIVTEDIRAGTSRNAGSDKQTYYKLTLAGGEDDSVGKMARALWDGGCVDGDIALCEAALSAECFFKLASLGVPFPKNRYGEWVGYKTDHDPQRRATSAGPYTSKLMTEKLQAAVEARGVPTYDRLLAVRLLGGAGDGGIRGVLCLDLDAAANDRVCFVAFCCTNVVLATGGAAGLYADSVYPLGQHGSNGLAFEAGALGKNLTEWQYGLASSSPRWNVSGTFMQALPRFVSVGRDGSDEREFLMEYFGSAGEMLTNVFLKGYQWPFDVGKATGGSSLIDLCVFCETLRGRAVYLDYAANPLRRAIDFQALGGEARAYLESAGTDGAGSPYDRLSHMNRPAVEFYLEHGVDLSREPLEISLCAQHNNGGVAADIWWQTRVEGLFTVGEACATHGVYRPGGSALNAGQAGSLRAAQYIAARRAGDPPDVGAFLRATSAQMEETVGFARIPKSTAAPYRGPSQFIEAARARMSRAAGAVRGEAEIRAALTEVAAELAAFPDAYGPDSASGLPALFILRELLISQSVYLSAFLDYILNGGKSRGGALYTDASGELPHGALPAAFRYTADGGEKNGLIQETAYGSDGCAFTWRGVRGIPGPDDFFENVWRAFRAGEHTA